MKNKVTAVLLAGGKGTRFDPGNLKTLHKVNGKTLTEMVIEDIKSSNLFDEIVLVYNKKHKATFLKIAKHNNIKSTVNGSTRFFSALNGVKEALNEKIIFIDVAAPFYQHMMLKEMINKLDKYTGVMTTALDSRADHVLISGGEVTNVFKRGEILRVKSYQGVNRKDWLESILDVSANVQSVYTEMLSVLMDKNFKIGNVTAENNPRKITTINDLKFFNE